MMTALWERLPLFGLPCLFHEITGLYCPGCGGTRAVKALLTGEFRLSIQYHPLIPYIACVVLLEAATWLFAKVFHKPALHVRRYDFFVLIGAVIVVLNWLFKNYMLIAHGIDLLP